MDDYEYFEGWPRWLRWTLFLPMAVIGYTVAFFFGRFVIWWSYGWIGISEKSVIGHLIYGFHVNFLCFFFGFVVSVSCIPRGRIILQSIYFAILLFVMGFSSLSIITYGDSKGDPGWTVAYDFILNILAGVTVLWMVIYDYKQKRETIMEKVAVVLARQQIEHEQKMLDPNYAEKEALVKKKLGL